MGAQISRRGFLRTSVITLGSVIICRFNIFPGTEKAVAVETSAAAAKEIIMPHVIVKLLPGRSEQQKVDLAESIVRNVVDSLDIGEDSVSVAIEEIESGEWRDKVYKPDILDRPETLYKKPGYTM